MPKIVQIAIAFADKDEMMMNNGSIFIFLLLNPLSRPKNIFFGWYNKVLNNIKCW